jgi:protein involved in polysaccharide export with SLBB domain
MLMPRPGRSLWRLTFLGVIVTWAIGCAGDAAQLNRALLSERNPAAHCGDLTAHYTVYSPDVLDLTIPAHPDWCGRHPVNPDGRIALGGVEFPRVDGRTVPEIAQLLAAKCCVPVSQVRVHVTDYNSQRLYVQSEAPGLPQVVAYQGPETIVDFLQRVGGVSQRGAPHDIQVVRSHVADGQSPEVFHVDLEEILLKQDQRTNVALQSFDQVYIGQSRGSCFFTCVPPWMRPFFRNVCGISRLASPVGIVP